MTTDELRGTLLAQLANGDNPLALHATLKNFARSGGRRADARQILEDLLRSGIPEEQDNSVRDALDFVLGWCSKHMRIWPDSTDS